MKNLLLLLLLLPIMYCNFVSSNDNPPKLVKLNQVDVRETVRMRFPVIKTSLADINLRVSLAIENRFQPYEDDKSENQQSEPIEKD